MNPALAVSSASLEALELQSLLRLLAELAASDLGRDRLLALRPLADGSALASRRARFAELERLLGEGPLVPSSEAPLLPLLERLEGARAAWDGQELVRLADLLRSSRAAGERIRAAAPPCPALRERAAALPDAGPLVRRIETTLDRRGEVRDDASPRLAELRRSIRRLRERLYKELQGLLGELREHLAEDTIPLRNGRLVLLLQAGARGRVRGLLHGRSGTGKSFYFEPLVAVEGNNQLQQALEDEDEERRRLLVELGEEVRAAAGLLAGHADFFAELDSLQAAARFAALAGARLAETCEPPVLRLVAARHPLLEPRLADLRRAALGQAGHTGPVVPLDLELDADRRLLVVTGPNAGGKTVALKTVGLLTLAHQCGLPVPADSGTRLPVLERLVATVGDEQDLLAERSTFSGRLLRLREAWEAASPGSLVLLDELGSGTDPQEGAALAVALVEGLLERRTLAVVTTHLFPLAAAALELPGASCAAMEFSPESAGATFRLLPGPPGGSEALALARRLGLPEEWLDRAEARLGAEHRDLRRLLAELDRARRETVEARERLEREAGDVATLRRRLERAEAELAAERQAVAARLRAELGAFKSEVARRLSGEIERVRSEARAGKRRSASAEGLERLFAGAPELPEAAAAAPVAVGGRVRHRQQGWEGTLEQLADGRAQVRVGGKRLRCAAEELVGVETAARPPATSPAPAASRRAGDLDAPEAPAEVNLIGQRVEPALAALDGFLDQALLGARPEVRIVHGHGTGRLRDAVRRHLRRHAAVAAQRPGAPEEGGNGATVVTLRRE
jgi:DNA mismatch repair protein MutS2